MKTYSIEQLDDIINRRVKQRQTLEQIAAETEFTYRELSALNHCLNTTRPCKHCGRPVPINIDVKKDYCNKNCLVNHFTRGPQMIDLGDEYVPGRKFALSVEQIKDAALRYVDFHDTLSSIADDLGVAPSTLLRTFNECGIQRRGKTPQHKNHFTRTLKRCLVCGVEFQGVKSARYCGSPSCRGKAYYRRHKEKLKEQASV
jgi:hypothetical protein